MEIGLVGLGRMGGGILGRLAQSGHTVVAYDSDPSVRVRSATTTSRSVEALEDVPTNLSEPVSILLCLPSGEATENTISKLSRILSPGDSLIDTGNSNYKDSIRRGSELNTKGINFLDVGISGGIWGHSMGYSLTVGGPEHVFRDLLPLFQALSPQDSKGFAHVGQQGAGHFAKMVHNGIEYGLMQAYSEGFDLLHSNPSFDFDLEQIAGVWNSSSVIRSWLLELTQVTLKENPSMVNVLPYVQDSGEGRWAVEEAVRSGIPVPVMYSALQSRFQSQNTDSFSFKLLACMRQQFGGHPASSR